MSEVNSLLVERLAQDVLEAARNGKWDQAIALYDRRLSEGQLTSYTPEMIKLLVQWDQWLITRIREAQAAILQNLLEIQDQRRKLEILKSQWGGKASGEVRHLLTI